MTADGIGPECVEGARRIAGKYRRAHVEKRQEFDWRPGYTKARGED